MRKKVCVKEGIWKEIKAKRDLVCEKLVGGGKV